MTSAYWKYIYLHLLSVFHLQRSTLSTEASSEQHILLTILTTDHCTKLIPLKMVASALILFTTAQFVAANVV